jgi:hypothetical protein
LRVGFSAPKVYGVTDAKAGRRNRFSLVSSSANYRQLDKPEE